MARFDISGDYEALVEFLEPVLPDELPASLLREAAFHERTLRIPQARKTLQRFSAFLREAELPFPQVLLRDPLLERFTWAEQTNSSQAPACGCTHSDWPPRLAARVELTLRINCKRGHTGV